RGNRGRQRANLYLRGGHPDRRTDRCRHGEQPPALVPGRKLDPPRLLAPVGVALPRSSLRRLWTQSTVCRRGHFGFDSELFMTIRALLLLLCFALLGCASRQSA